MSMSAVFFIVQLDPGTFCVENVASILDLLGIL